MSLYKIIKKKKERKYHLLYYLFEQLRFYIFLYPYDRRIIRNHANIEIKEFILKIAKENTEEIFQIEFKVWTKN